MLLQLSDTHTHAKLDIELCPSWHSSSPFISLLFETMGGNYFTYDVGGGLPCKVARVLLPSALLKTGLGCWQGICYGRWTTFDLPSICSTQWFYLFSLLVISLHTVKQSSSSLLHMFTILLNSTWLCLSIFTFYPVRLLLQYFVLANIKLLLWFLHTHVFYNHMSLFPVVHDLTFTPSHFLWD